MRSNHLSKTKVRIFVDCATLEVPQEDYIWLDMQVPGKTTQSEIGWNAYILA